MISALFPLFLCFFAISIYFLLPLRMKLNLQKNGLNGPPPSFPLGNLTEMSKSVKELTSVSTSTSMITHDIHSIVFPYFASWSKTYGKVFVYWLGTEPFLYVADPEFIKQATGGALSKKWGKPNVFNHDRRPMFGNGLLMIEGDVWSLHRNIMAPAFSLTNLNAMTDMIVESTVKMLEKWKLNISNGENEIDMEEEITENAAEIMGKITFGSINDEDGKKLLHKLQQVQARLFNTNRLVGVPFSNYLLHPKKERETKKIGKEIDRLLHSMIDFRTRQSNQTFHRKSLLDLLLAGKEMDGKSLERKRLSKKELVDECKTFFFAGHETTALTLTWTLLMLAVYPEWQDILRQEIVEVCQGKALDATMLPKLKKMEWVLNEVLRLYGPAPNAQRQAREDVQVGNIVIPKGTNMWIDTVAMHHDESLWGHDVYEFKPERFDTSSLHGGCKHRLGFAPFGFGSRLCIGRNLTVVEYKIVLSGIVRSYGLSVSTKYVHSPKFMLTLRPSHGVQLVLHPLN